MRRVRKTVLTALAALAVLGGVLFSAGPALAETNYGVTGSFGSATSSPADPEPLSEPWGVAVSEAGAAKGDVYVVDRGHKRVEYFSATGVYLGQFNGRDAPAGAFETLQEGIAVDNDPSSPSFGDVYVADARTSEVLIDKFSPTGSYITQLKGTCEHENESVVEPGACPNSANKKVTPFHEFHNRPMHGLAVDPDGNLWAYQGGSEEVPHVGVDEFSSTGIFVKSFTKQYPYFAEAEGIAVNSSDNVYVDGGAELNPAIYKFSSTGALLEEGVPGTALAVEPLTNNLFVDRGSSIAEQGSLGLVEPPIATFPFKGFAESHGIAVTSTGTIYATQRGAGDVDIFTVGASPETPITQNVEEITATSATVHGELRGGETEYYFEYNDNGGCTGGESTPVVAATGTDEKVSAHITGLEPSKQYSVCLVSESTYGTSFGSAESLTTLAAPPEILSESAFTLETPAERKFSAEINPNNQETTYIFEYATEASVNGKGELELEGKIKTAEGGAISAGLYGAQSVESATVEGLGENGAAETYYYRVVVASECEPVAHPGQECTTYGKVQAYTKVPIVEGELTFGLTLTSATLQATINPDFQGTEYHFDYSTEATENVSGEKELAGAITTVPGGSVPNGTGFNAQPVSSTIDGLNPYTVYYYRVVANNGSTETPSNADKGLPVVGAVEKFETRSLPLPTTGEAAGITGTSATLAGTVIAPFVQASYYYEFISEAAYQAALANHAANSYGEGETTTPVTVKPSETPQVAGPVSADGLLPATTYHYRLVVNNEFGWEYGADHTFTTEAPTPPSVSTGGASGISQNAATLSGTVTTNGLQTNYGFEISAEPFQPGAHVPATGLGAIGGAATEEVHLTLGELQPGTTYYYRVEATNADGADQGRPASFTTPGFPTLLTPQTSPPLIAVPSIVFPKEEKTSTVTTTETLTNREKLSKALEACKRDKRKGMRRSCERQARSRYGAAKRGKRKKARRK